VFEVLAHTTKPLAGREVLRIPGRLDELSEDLGWALSQHSRTLAAAVGDRIRVVELFLPFKIHRMKETNVPFLSDIDQNPPMDFVHPLEALIPGVQGRVLAVLAETTADLNLRTIDRLSGTSVAQTSRVLPDLVSLGLVERREAPPSALFHLVREHVAADVLLTLARARDEMTDRMKTIATDLPVAPVSVIVFGSFARGEADAKSDIDTILVRPADIEESDDAWAASVQMWSDSLARVSGNRVEVLEVAESDIGHRFGSRQELWRDVRSEGIVIVGTSLDELRGDSDG
jgi:predicted nucleotidyltransferase